MLFCGIARSELHPLGLLIEVPGTNTYEFEVLNARYNLLLYYDPVAARSSTHFRTWA